MKKECENFELSEEIREQLNLTSNAIDINHLGYDTKRFRIAGCGRVHVGIVELKDGRVYQYMINPTSNNERSNVLKGIYLRVDGKNFPHCSLEVILGCSLGEKSKALDVKLFI